MSPGLWLILTSPRVAPGLLSGDAWRVLSAADRRYAATADDPLAAAVGDAGLAVEAIDLAVGVSALAQALLDRATRESVVWLVGADGDPGLTDALAAQASALAEPPPLEIVVGSWDVPGSRLLDVVAVMDRLRSPGGCPWDAQQTHESLLPYLHEEADEYTQAVHSGDRAHMAEELGDVLLQVAFHARVAQDDPDEPFGIDEVAGLLVEKLVRRHPHVFADGDASTPEEVEAAWARIKAAEQAERAARAAADQPSADHR